VLLDGREAPVSELLPSASPCCTPCPSPTTTDIPGPPGDPGTPGTNGTNGKNAFTTVGVQFAMPTYGGTVVVTVVDSSFMAVNELVYLGVTGGAAQGTLQVTLITSPTIITLKNVATGNTSADAYASNSAPTTTFAVGTVITPIGQQGIPGTNGTGGAPIAATYVTQSPDGTLTNEFAMSAATSGLVKNVFGVGISATSVPLSTANNAVAPVDQVAGMTAGQIVQATAAGIKTDTAANTRTALGLGSIATQAASAVAITGGTIAGTAISTSSVSATTLAVSTSATLAALLALTPTAIQSLLAANPLAVAATSKVRVKGSAAPITCVATPSISIGTIDGQLLLVQGSDSTNTWTVQDSGTLASSQVRLGATTRTLKKGSQLLLTWDTTDATWYEIAFQALV
jgi:hypothetical protein